MEEYINLPTAPFFTDIGMKYDFDPVELDLEMKNAQRAKRSQKMEKVAKFVDDEQIMEILQKDVWN